MGWGCACFDKCIMFMDSWIGHFCCVFKGKGSTTLEVETSFATMPV